MASRSLGIWSAGRLPRLAALGAQCAATAGDPALHGPNLRGFVLLLSAEFQGFCRELYWECTRAVVRLFPASLQPVAEAQFLEKLLLDRANPTVETLRGDFDRFDFSLGAAIAANPANAPRVTGLGRLNAWRNHVAHATVVPPAGGPLTLADIQGWVRSCDGLAAELDAIMYNRLLTVVGSSPW